MIYLETARKVVSIIGMIIGFYYQIKKDLPRSNNFYILALLNMV